MSVSTFINYRNVDDVYDQIVNYLQKGYVTVDIEKVTFTQGVSEYTLANSNLINIISIEGVKADGHIIPPTGTFNGVSALSETADYTLVRDTEKQDSYGEELYDRINFIDNQLFENNSTIYITYVYYDENKKTNITNFTNGSISAMLARGIAIQLSNLYSQNERLYNAGSVATATASDLDNHGEIWGISRDEGSVASGTVFVTVGASESDLTVNTSTAFVASLAGNDLIFTATEGGTVSAGTSAEFEVQSTENGYKYNVGANSITKIYSNTSLTTEISNSNITVVNNPLKLDSSSNLFSGGTDRQTDQEYRESIYLQSYKVGRGTKSAVKSAIEDLDIVSSVTVKDFASNKDIANGLFYVQAVGNTGYKLLTDVASITALNNTIDKYRPVGTTYGIQHPIPIMIDMSGTITIEESDFPNSATIKTLVQTNIENYINSLNIGEDVLYAEIIDKAMNIGGVYDFSIDKINYTEFASNPIALDKTTNKISDNVDGGGTSYRTYYQEFKFMPNGRVDEFIWSGNNTFNTDYTPIVDSPTPSVYLAIDDGTSNYIRNPAYSIDWYSSNGTSTIVIDETLGSGVNRLLSSGVDVLMFNYETATTDTIDGIRLKLHGGFVSGTESGTVKVEIWSGINSPASGVLLESGTITVLSGTDDYEMLFSSPLTVGNPENTYYISFSGTSAMGSGAYISVPTSSSGTAGSQNTAIFSGSTADLQNNTMGRIINSTAMVHTLIVNSGVTNINIEGTANIPDVAVVYQVDIDAIIKS